MRKQIKCPSCGRWHAAEVLEGLCRKCLIEISVFRSTPEPKRNRPNQPKTRNIKSRKPTPDSGLDS